MNHAARSRLVVVFNGESALEYDRSKPIAPRQREYLDRMDQKMDGGIDLEGVTVAAPDDMQRARFVAAQLVHALLAENEPHAAAMTGYLADRLPDLQQVRVQLEEGEATIDLVFDEAWVRPAPVQFMPRTRGEPTRH